VVGKANFNFGLVGIIGAVFELKHESTQ